ncbi:hypothetical protein HA402_014795 [Bradysia odoriphaga]|nr:hypothetical protein HA402_014795 [Bradysia odoriphaga]
MSNIYIQESSWEPPTSGKDSTENIRCQNIVPTRKAPKTCRNLLQLLQRSVEATCLLPSSNPPSNIGKSLGHDVNRMNYLGDFGPLQIGMEFNKLSTKDIRSDPITHPFNAYVQANQLAAWDPSF